MLTDVWTLWLPVVVSGVALFFASWIAWMLLPHHKAEWKGLPNEDAVMKAVRDAGVSPGQYSFPHCGCPGDMKSEAFKAKMKAGPCGSLIVWKGSCSMGANLFCTWALFTVLSFVISYLAALALAPGAEPMKVFRFVGSAGILTYASSGLLDAIWFKRKSIGNIFDGIAYGLITGGIFAWLWPAAEAALTLPPPAV